MERVMGIEPTLAAWEAAVLPLNYTRARADLMRVAFAFATARSEEGVELEAHLGAKRVERPDTLAQLRPLANRLRST
jgi:hypothetical protein